MLRQPILQFDNVTKAYGQNVVLDTISFKVNKGERIALIGASGAGKSTLLHLISNALKADSGSIRVEGQPIEAYANPRIFSYKVGIMRQQFDLVLPLKVINNVLIGRLREWGFFKSLFSLFFYFDRSIALKALHDVGIEHKAYERTSCLSGGEQQRVAMARLLVQAPDIILADEPIASLDPSRSEAMIQLMLNLSKDNNHTLLVSLHSLEIALSHFDRVLALESGHIVYDGHPAKLDAALLERIYAFKESNHHA